MKKYIFGIFCGIMCIVCSLSCVNIKNVCAEENSLLFNCSSSILVDFNSGEVLFEQDADKKVQVASIVKLMTVLLTFEELDSGRLNLSDVITTTENASGMGGSQVFIDPYENYTVEEMLKSVIVASANDASVALAEHISGSEEKFVEKMNQKAKELGLNNTVYVNASGLPQPGQYSTARDVAKLTKEVTLNKRYFEYSTIWMDKLIHPSGRETEVVNTNKLIRYFKGCDAGKTGSTDEAGYCLTATAKRDDMRLIGVILGAKNATERFNETSRLLNYGFSNFENKNIVSTKNPICETPILRSKIKSIPVFASQDFTAVCQKGEVSNFEISTEINDKIKAPLSSGDIVGKLTVSKNGVVVREIDLVVGSDVNAISYGDSLKEIISNW